jgi:hypothetical protein
MPVQGMLNILPLEVTPEAGEGTLGTWRFRGGPGHRARITVPLIVERVSQANHGCAGRARCQPERFGPRGQAAKESQGQNRTGEYPLSGIAGRPEETWPKVGLGSQPATERAVLVTPA